MATPNTSEKSNALDREENITRGNLSAKRVVNYTYDASTDTLLPVSGTSTPPKASDEYGIQAISDDGTYKYFFFENDSTNYFVMRKNLTTKVFSYTKGTGSYTTVYQSEILGPSGSPTWGTRGATFP